MTERIKPCSKCRAELPYSRFAKSPLGRGGLRAECRVCQAAMNRDYNLRSRFGVTSKDYDALLAAQGGKCALCESRRPGGRWERFAVDHCHQTGRVRGLLCYGCNVALGRLGDTPERLLRAYQYVSGGAAHV
jgi:hypothetical protein